MYEGDIVGIREPNLYTGVGTVKEHHRGVIKGFAMYNRLVIVKFPQHTGNTMLFAADLIVYGHETAEID